MKICSKCIQPDTRPNIYFNEEGVCGACLWEEEKNEINWNVREKELQELEGRQKCMDFRFVFLAIPAAVVFFACRLCFQKNHLCS